MDPVAGGSGCKWIRLQVDPVAVFKSMPSCGSDPDTVDPVANLLWRCIRIHLKTRGWSVAEKQPDTATSVSADSVFLWRSVSVYPVATHYFWQISNPVVRVNSI